MKLDLKLAVSIIIVAAILIVNIAPGFFSQAFNQLQQIVKEWGLPGFYAILMVQSIIAVIPSEAVLIMGGSAFGFIASSTVGTIGLMSGAVVNYVIGLKLGKTIVEKLVSSKDLERTERLFSRHGSKIIFAARFIPWVSFDAVSYFAGLVEIAFKPFMVATLLGTVPRAFFYSYLGEKVGAEVSEGSFTLLNYLLMAALIIILVVIVLSSRRGTSGKPPGEA